MNRKLIIMSLLASYLTMNATWAVKEDLELFPNEGTKSVTLPFPYKHLESENKDKVKFIPERFYTVLSDNSPTEAIVGPLQPCIFVGLRNNENGKTIVFHKHFSNNINSMIELAQNELKVKDPANIKGALFTATMGAYDMPMQFYHGMSTMKIKHNGKTQIEELKLIKDSLITAFNIKDRTQISAQKFTSSLADNELGGYEFAELNILVDNQLQLKSICVMHEGIFGDFSSMGIKARCHQTIVEQQKVKQPLLEKHFFGKTNNEQLNTYNAVHFEKL